MAIHMYAFALLALVLVPYLALADDTAGGRFEVQYRTKKFKLINVTDTAGYCMNPHPVKASDSNRDNFINSDMRFALCKLSIEKIGKEFDSTFGRVCFEDEGHVVTRWNPCALICMEKSKLSNSWHNEDCDSSDQQENTFLITDFPCGEQHFCDSNGCCREKIAEPTSEVTTTTSPTTEPQTTSVTDNPTTIPPTVPKEPETTPTVPKEPETTPTVPKEPETTPTVPKEPETTPTPTEPTTLKPRKKHTCDRPGYFIDEENPQFYYHCKFFAAIHSCGSDEKFDFSVSKCVYDRNIKEPTLEFPKWKDAVTCPKFGTYMRSPYDCKYFYSCEPDGNNGFRIYFNYCFGGLIFSNDSQSCEYKTHRCNNLLTLPDDVDKHRL